MRAGRATPWLVAAIARASRARCWRGALANERYHFTTRCFDVMRRWVWGWWESGRSTSHARFGRRAHESHHDTTAQPTTTIRQLNIDTTTTFFDSIRFSDRRLANRQTNSWIPDTPVKLFVKIPPTHTPATRGHRIESNRRERENRNPRRRATTLACTTLPNGKPAPESSTPPPRAMMGNTALAREEEEASEFWAGRGRGCGERTHARTRQRLEGGRRRRRLEILEHCRWSRARALG